MSVIVTAKTSIQNADVAYEAFKRHFKEVSRSASTINFRVKAENRGNPEVHVEMDTKTFSIRYDSDYTGITEKINQVYALEEAIQAAEAERRTYEYSYNDSEKSFVLEIMY